MGLIREGVKAFRKRTWGQEGEAALSVPSLNILLAATGGLETTGLNSSQSSLSGTLLAGTAHVCNWKKAAPLGAWLVR